MSNTALTAGNMIAAVLQWVLLLILLRLFVYKPILAAMQKRRETIAKQLGESGHLKEEADKLRDEARQVLDQARDEAKQVLANARREADEQARKIVEQAQREASYRQKTAVEEIEHERTQALTAIRTQVADLVVFAASKVIERNLTQEDQRRYVEEVINDAEQLQ